MNNKDKEIKNKKNSKTKIISISSIRGGPGKSTLTLALAIYLLRKKLKVLLFDFDINGPFLDLFFKTIPKNTITEYIALINTDIDSQKLANYYLTPIMMNDLIHIIKIDSLEFHVIFASRDLLNIKTCLNFLNTDVGFDFAIQSFMNLKKNYDYDYIIIDNSPGILDTNLLVNYIADYVFIIMRKRKEEIKEFEYWRKIFENVFNKNKNLITWQIILNQVFKNKNQFDEVHLISDRIWCEVPFYEDLRTNTKNELKYLLLNKNHSIFENMEKIFNLISNTD
ncbi:MAG: AAA family ATPase [Candidatus Helarchaeota archaeon]